MKVGDVVKVQASESLGTPEAEGTVHTVMAEPGHIDYPYGLYVINIGGDIGAMVDNRGVCYAGPPCKGVYVSWP